MTSGRVGTAETILVMYPTGVFVASASAGCGCPDAPPCYRNIPGDGSDLPPLTRHPYTVVADSDRAAASSRGSCVCDGE